MKRTKSLSLLLIPLSLALSCISLQTNYFMAYADEATNGFINNSGSSAHFTALGDGGVSLDMTANDSFRYEDVIYDDYIDFYIDFVTDDVRFTFILDDANNNHQDWIIMQRYWGGVNFQTMNYWGDPGGDYSLGYQHFHLELTSQGTKYYYNDRLITQSQVNKTAYTNGVKLVFQLETKTDFSAKIRVGKAAFTDNRKTTIKNSEQNVRFGFSFAKATVSSLTLDGNASYTIPSESYTLGSDSITINGGYIKDSVAIGSYELKANFGSEYASATLIVADKAEMELVEDAFVFDKYIDGDIVIETYQNGDSFTQITGNSITNNDYSFNNIFETITINHSYLVSLDVGNYTFKAFSNAVPLGIDFSIQITDSAPPICNNPVQEYDTYLNNDVSFAFDLKQNQFISLTGNEITNSDYSFLNNVLTINGQFLKKFNPLETVIFVASFTYGNAQLTINVISTEKAEILVSEQRININSLCDAEYNVNIKYDEIISLSGNSITSNDWYFDTDRSVIVIKSSYISTLTINSYTFNGTTHNGLEFVLTLILFDSASPSLVSDDTLNYEKTNADEVMYFSVNPQGGTFISISEDKKVIDGYSVTTIDIYDRYVFNKQFLLSLTNGEHIFTIKYSNGVIDVSITISNNASPYFTNNQKIKYDVCQAGSYEIEILSNHGVFDKIIGNNITDSDYSYNQETNKLFISESYLDSLNSHTAIDFRLMFDNGELTLHITREVLESYENAYYTMYTWEEPEGSVITSSSDDGWVDVNYVRPKTADFAGGVEVKQHLDVTKPITFYVDFRTVPTLAGSSFAFTLSSGNYKMYYDNGYGASEVFGVFGVGNTYLKSAYFGRPGIDSEPNRQIPHEYLKRSELGYEAVTFDIGEESTKIYLNGLMIRETDLVKRSNFDNGVAYGLFTPHFWQDQEGAEFRIKLENNSKILDDLTILNTNSMNNININVYTGASVVRNVYLSNDIKMLPLTGYHVTPNYEKGTAQVIIPANAIIYRDGFDKSFDKIVVKTDQLLSVPLQISHNDSIDLYVHNQIFDVNDPQDCIFNYLKNNDTITSITGSGITSMDYGVSNTSIFLKKEFLSTLDYGEHEFTINANLGSEKIIIKVVDSTAPIVSGETQLFDINNPTNLVYQFVASSHDKLEVKGNNIAEDDYDIIDDKITLHSNYLSTLRVGTYHFSFLSYYADNLYSETSFDVEIINTQKPSFDVGDTLSVNYISGSHKSLSISVKENNGKLIEIEGGYITADYYKNSDGVITFFDEWLETLPDGNTTLILKYDNGSLTVNINKLPAERYTPKAKINYNLWLYIVLGCSAVFCLGAALAFILIRRKKKHEKSM